MKYRVMECSGQGLRYDIITPGGERICIAHSERDANTIARALNAAEKKIMEIDGGDGTRHPIYGSEFAAAAIADVLARLNELEAKEAQGRGHDA